MRRFLMSVALVGLGLTVSGTAMAGGKIIQTHKEFFPVVIKPTPAPIVYKPAPEVKKEYHHEESVVIHVDVPPVAPPPVWIPEWKFSYSFKGWDAKHNCFIFYCPETSRFYRFAEEEHRFMPVG